MQILLAIAFSISLENLIYVVLDHTRVPVFQSYILEPLALLPTIPLAHINHKQTRTSSSILLLFWPTYAVAVFIWGRTIVTVYSENLNDFLVPLSMRFGVVVFGLLSFAFELVAPEFKPHIGEETGDAHVENPILSANIFSRWTFGYMTPMLKKGSKKFITDRDLPSLLKQDQATELGQRLTAALAKR